MYNIRRSFDKILNLVKDVLGDDCPETGNFLRPGLKPLFTDIEVIALSFTAESLSIDSENRLFTILNFEYKNDFPNLLSRRQYNDRRKILFHEAALVRQKMADRLNAITDVYAVDSMPLEICKLSRAERNKMSKDDEDTKPTKGFCAAQDKWYFGYKAHCVCSPVGVIQLFDLTAASVHDVNFLKDIKANLSDCIITGDRGYISKSLKTELLHEANIDLEIPYRANQTDKKPILKVFRVIRKRVETVFSQLCDQFMIQRNYAKSYYGYRTRIMAKISGFTVLQFINKFITCRPVGRVKNALCY